MASQYAALSDRALATITRKGADVTFTEFPSGVTATSKAVQDEGDPDRALSLKLELVNPVTLIVSAVPLGAFKPASGQRMLWADGVTYVVKDAEPVAPDGVPIIWTVTGSA